jgi:hypothetical protein
VWLSELLVSFVPTDVTLQARLDARVLLFTLGITGIHIVDGRAFDTGDEASGRRVAIIDQAMAAR